MPGQDIEQFVERIFNHKVSFPWWSNIEREVRQRKTWEGRYLEEELEREIMGDFPSYRSSDRQLFFFSGSIRQAIDGRINNVGIEEKCKKLRFVDLIDGAIHRGLLWVLGNPQQLREEPPVESLSIYLLRTDYKPFDNELASLLIPTLEEIAKHGIHVLFVNQSGEHWMFDETKPMNIPYWLGDSPYRKKMSPHSSIAVASLKQGRFELIREKYLYKSQKRLQFNEVRLENGETAAVMRWDNYMQMIEIGLFLRALGYSAVRVDYDDKIYGHLSSAGYGVEKRIQQSMMNLYGVILDWKTSL